MAFILPEYRTPDFTAEPFKSAPAARFEAAPKAGVAPVDYHATSIYPEYFQVAPGDWRLPRESRMDCVVVLQSDGSLTVKEFRHIAAEELVAIGRRENCEDGIFVHSGAFGQPDTVSDKFAFRTQVSRETAFSADYDELYGLLDHERNHGFILWVLGPAVSFDRDARNAFTLLVRNGYVDGLLAGNALAAHDIEGALFNTALGQDLYTKRHVPLGHYKHLDAINRIRELGSIEAAIRIGMVSGGIMDAVTRAGVPYVLAGSIRDDGPLPEVVANVYAAQDRMRDLARRATTVIAMATQLHSIATGNMIPAYRVMPDDSVRPVYFYTVDMSEFAANKLADRGSLTARSILTNAQDFVVNLERGLLGK